MNAYITFYLLSLGLHFLHPFYLEYYESQKVFSNERSFYPDAGPRDSTTVDWENDSTYILNYALEDIKLKEAYTGPISKGQIDNSKLIEVSGMVEGRNNTAILWVHNDSGGNPNVYALDKRTGNYLGKISVLGASNEDWEDIAIGAGPEEGRNYLYIGDIGDNAAVRPFLKIYRIAEPSVTGDMTFENIETESKVITYEYPEGARDAEAMLVDPISKDIIIVTKREKYVNVYCLPFVQLNQEKITPILLGKLPFRNVVAADISSDGRHVLLKNYEHVYHWARKGNEHLKYTFSRCPERLPYEPEAQGESIAWSNEEEGYFTLSEAHDVLPDLYYYGSKN